MDPQRALIVDDSRDFRSVLGTVLRGLGFDVHEAGDGAEALAVLARINGAQLALVDWCMQGMDGIEFLRRARAQPSNAGMRILMVTGQSDAERVVEALDAGADEFLMKPITRRTVLDKLALLGFECAATE